MVERQAVDHDHVTGFVRGVLCTGCNSGMGQLRGDPWVIRRAIEYLTGGHSGIRRTGDGGFEVTVVRPEGAAPKVDPGWDVGNIGGHDLALLHALAYGDSDDP
jgi:Recombination endonuclease VII